MWPFRRKRLLFRYYDGEKWVAADPLRIYRKITKEADHLVALATAFDQQRDPEASEFIDLVAEIFGLVRYNPVTGAGLTDSEVAGVFQQFDAFVVEIRDRFFPGSTSQPVSAGGSCDSPKSQPETPAG
jgi:hypothetical protein